MVHPPKVEAKIETKKEKKYRDDNPDKEKQKPVEVKLNVATIQKALNSHIKFLEEVYQKENITELGVVILRLYLIFH